MFFSVGSIKVDLKKPVWLNLHVRLLSGARSTLLGELHAIIGLHQRDVCKCPLAPLHC